MKNVVAVIIRYKDKVLLTKREDFEFWCLPGGYVEEEETQIAAVWREVEEETGLRLLNTKLIIQCRKPNWRNGILMLIFESFVDNEKVELISPEVKDIGFFSINDFPYPMLKEHAEYIVLPKSKSIIELENNLQSPWQIEINKAECEELFCVSKLNKANFYASLFMENPFFEK